MQNLKKDFPILINNSGIVYMDSTATSQKPAYVIDAIKSYLENDYSNIHRGAYTIAENSEKLYIDSKKKVAKFLWALDWREIIYSFNSTYASNLLVSSLKRSSFFKKWDKILVSIVEHHANVVPWLILAEEIWVEIDYININDDFSLDFDDLENKLDSNVKSISITHVSNVTWEIFDLERLWNLLNEKCPSKWEKPLFIVDASQSFPHMKIDVKKLWCDFLFFTAHKVMADSWLWVLWWKKDFLENLKPAFSWWWAISWVKKTCFKEAWLPDRFEPGTPNLTWAVSLLRALEYVENIWWYDKIEEIEKELSSYFLEKFDKLSWVKLIWWKILSKRVSVFSFIVDAVHSLDIAEYLAENNICIRAWQHCAEPFMWELWVNHTCRASLYIYNTKEDIDKFFEVLEKAIIDLK